MRKQHESPETIAERIAEAHRRAFQAFGREWQGDVFYSTIQLHTKKLPTGTFHKVCDLLKDKGFYVHS